jgi:8-hydroxy-5-deazaflavin:NADPH oxidoreductase
MPSISILGTGSVGQTLALGFLRGGFAVTFGTGHPDKTIEWQDPVLASLPALSYADAAKISEMVVFCMKGKVAESVAREVAPHIAGKVVIDTTNPIADAPPEKGVLKFFTYLDDSLMERLQRAAPQAKFVKAFNSVGALCMVHPDFGGLRPTMFICGDDEGAKKSVVEILDHFGWDAEDMGSALSARAIEPLAMLWCIPGFQKNDWTHAFKLLKPSL